MTVIWHLDDLTVLYGDSVEITKFANYLVYMYGKWQETDGVLREVHDYIIVDLYYAKKGEIQVSINKYLDNIFIKFWRKEEVSDHPSY